MTEVSQSDNPEGASNRLTIHPGTGNPELLRVQHQLAAVQRISQALFQTIDIDELIEITLRTALEEIDAEAGSILLDDPEAEQLVFRYSIGEKPVPRGTSIPWDKGISGAVFRSGEPRITGTAEQSAIYRQIDQDTGVALEP
jgi:hypothetical protein